MQARYLQLSSQIELNCLKASNTDCAGATTASSFATCAYAHARRLASVKTLGQSAPKAISQGFHADEAIIRLKNDCPEH